MKPTASCEAAQLWVRATLPPHIVPRRWTDASPMMLRMVVGPALRNQERVSGRLSHSCAPSELAVGFWWIRVPSGHGAVQSYVLHGSDLCSAMGGCVATARRHSLPCLPWLLWGRRTIGILLLHLFHTPPESLFFIHIYYKRYPIYYQRFIHL